MGKVGGVEVGCDDGLTGCVIEVGGEYLLGIDECADTELSETVVGGIAIWFKLSHDKKEGKGV